MNSPSLTYGEAFERLSVRERRFVTQLVNGFDIHAECHGRSLHAAYAMLGRVTVRDALMSVAPFLYSDIAIRIMRPYVLQQLVNASTQGDVAASKVLLSLPVNAARKVNYTDRARSTPRELHHGGTSLGVAGQVPEGTHPEDPPNGTQEDPYGTPAEDPQ